MYNCTYTVQDAENPEVKWFHNGREIEDSRPRTGITSAVSPNSSILTVVSVQRDDGGVYYCKVVFSNMVAMTSNNRSLMIHGIAIYALINSIDDLDRAYITKRKVFSCYSEYY